MSDYHKVDDVKDPTGRWYEITWSPSTGKVFATYTSGGLMPGRSHYEIGNARSPVEASYMGQAWAARQH